MKFEYPFLIEKNIIDYNAKLLLIDFLMFTSPEWTWYKHVNLRNKMSKRLNDHEELLDIDYVIKIY